MLNDFLIFPFPELGLSVQDYNTNCPCSCQGLEHMINFNSILKGNRSGNNTAVRSEYIRLFVGKAWFNYNRYHHSSVTVIPEVVCDGIRKYPLRSTYICRTLFGDICRKLCLRAARIPETGFASPYFCWISLKPSMACGCLSNSIFISIYTF